MRKIIYSVMALLFMIILTSCMHKQIVVQLYNGNELIEKIEVEPDKVFEQLKQPTLNDGFDFGGWFLDANFIKPVTKETKFGKEKEVKVYAKVTEHTYNLAYLDPVSNQLVDSDRKVKHTSLTKDETFAKLQKKYENLTLDTYYIDQECKTKFSNQKNITTLYFTYKALYTYHNGYEEIFSEMIKYNETPTPLNIDELVNKFSYMDKVGIETVCTDNTTVLTSPAIANKTFKVYWQTPNLRFNLNNKNNKLQVTNIHESMKDVPVISIPGKALFKAPGETEPTSRQVTTIHFGIGVNEFKNLNKIIINENIASITNFNFMKNHCPNLEFIELPQSLKIIDDSFNLLSPKVTKIELPETMEMIFSSFWDGDIDNITLLINKYLPNNNLRINLPRDVKTLGNVPSNLIIQNGHSHFISEDKRVYTSDKQTLVADYNVTDETLDLRSLNISQIQALAFAYNNVKTLFLPKTFTGVNLNPNYDEYKHYIGNALYCERNNRTIQYDSILWNLRKLDYVLIDTFKLAPSIKPSFIVGTNEDDQLAYDTYETFAEKVLFIGENTTHEQSQMTILLATPSSVQKITFTLAYDAVLNKTMLLSKITDQIIKQSLIRILKEDTVLLPLIHGTENFALGSKVKKNYYLALTVELQDLVSDQIVYEETDTEATIKTYPANDSLVYLPNQYHNKPVTRIGKHAFKGNIYMKTLFIPNSIKEIGEEAFMDCGALKDVVIQSTTEVTGLEIIRQGAFKNSSLVEITLPLRKMKLIEPYAFFGLKTREFHVPTDEIDRTITNTRITNKDTEFIEPGKYQDLGFTLWASLPNVNIKDTKITGTIGEYYIQHDMAHTRILKFTGHKTIQHNGKDIMVVETQLVAMCAQSNTDDWNINLIMFGNAGFHRNTKLPVYSYELLEGSVCTDGNQFKDQQIQFHLISISKAHKNAVYIEQDSILLTINIHTTKYINIGLCKYANLTDDKAVYNDLCFLTKEDMKDKNRFDEGWINEELDPDKLEYFANPGSLN